MRNGVLSHRQKKRVSEALAAAVLCAVLFAGCASSIPRGYVDATAWSANYTEDYINEFHLETTSGKNLLLSGVQVKEFTKGGTGGSECCSLIPGVDQPIRVVWTIANTDDKAQWKTYSRDVAVIGAMPKEKGAYNILMVRFFQDHQVEAELIPDRGKPGLPSPRVDKLFYGQRVMRHMGE